MAHYGAFFSTEGLQILIIVLKPFFVCLHHSNCSYFVSCRLVFFTLLFSCTPPPRPVLSSLSSPTLSSPLTLSFPNPSVPLLSQSLRVSCPPLNQQAAEDCGNPWNRRDQGCRQGATAALECGASEEIRAVSPARERGGMQRERSEGGWGGGVFGGERKGD